MAMEKGLYAAPMGLEEDDLGAPMEIEIEDPESVRIGLGDLMIDLEPKEEFWNIPGFKELWVQISPRTKYKLDFLSEDFISEAVKRLKACEPIAELKLTVSKHNVGEISEERGVVQGATSVKAGKVLNLSF